MHVVCEIALCMCTFQLCMFDNKQTVITNTVGHQVDLHYNLYLGRAMRPTLAQRLTAGLLQQCKLCKSACTKP